MRTILDIAFVTLLAFTSGLLGFALGRLPQQPPRRGELPGTVQRLGTIRFYQGDLPEQAQRLREMLADPEGWLMLRGWNVVEMPGHPPTVTIGGNGRTVGMGEVGHRLPTGVDRSKLLVAIKVGPALVAVDLNGREIGRWRGADDRDSLRRWVQTLRPWWRKGEQDKGDE